MYARIRNFFAQRNVLEVETPCLNSHTITDTDICSMHVELDNVVYHLHTSPEYAMKRLLVEYKQDIFQLCKVFRAGEQGKYHHHEFTLLEWYRVAFTHQQLMQELEELVLHLLDHVTFNGTDYISYREAFSSQFQFDVSNVTTEELSHVCLRAGIEVHSELTKNEYLDLLLDQIIVKTFAKDRLTFLCEYPEDQAALAKVNDQGVAERFELYIGEIELANGFQELTDADEQVQRFERDNVIRKQAGKPEVTIDHKFIQALRKGLPECAGVALGIDRLLMLCVGATDIKHVINFALE